MKKYLHFILMLLAATWCLPASAADVWTRVDHGSDAGGLGRVMWTEFENGAMNGRLFCFVNSTSSPKNLSLWGQPNRQVSAYAGGPNDTAYFNSQKLFGAEGSWLEQKIFKLEYVGESKASYANLEGVSHSMYRLYSPRVGKYVGVRNGTHPVNVFYGGSNTNAPYLVSTADSALLICFADAQSGTFAAQTTNVLSYGGTPNGGCVAITVAPGGNAVMDNGNLANTVDHHYAINSPGTSAGFKYVNSGTAAIAWSAYEVTLPQAEQSFANATLTARWYVDRLTPTIGAVGGISKTTADAYLTPLASKLAEYSVGAAVNTDSAKLYARLNLIPTQYKTAITELENYWRSACNVKDHPVVSTVNNGKFYYIQGFSNYQNDQKVLDVAGNVIDAHHFNGNVAYVRDRLLTPRTYTDDRYVRLDSTINYTNSAGNAAAIWQVEADADGRVTFRNLATGYYLNQLVPAGYDASKQKGYSRLALNDTATTHWTLDYLLQSTTHDGGTMYGPGWMRIIPADLPQEALYNTWSDRGVVTGWTKGGTQQGGFWVLHEVENPQDVLPLAAGYNIVTLPYRSLGPTAADGKTAVKVYSVAGLNKGTTGIALKDITGQPIEAGTPFIVRVDGDEAATVSMNPDLDNISFTATATPANGLHGLLGASKALTFKDGALPLSGKDVFIDANAAAGQVNAQGGYLVLNEVKGEAEGDAVLPTSSVLRQMTAGDAQGRAHEADVKNGTKVVFLNPANNSNTYLAANGTKPAYNAELSDAAVWQLEAAGTGALGTATKNYYYVRNYQTGRYLTSPDKGKTDVSADVRNSALTVAADDTTHALRLAVTDFGANGGTNAGYSTYTGMDNGGVDLIADPTQLKTAHSNMAGIMGVAHNSYIGNYNSQWGWYMWTVTTAAPNDSLLTAALAAADSTLALVDQPEGYAAGPQAAALRAAMDSVKALTFDAPYEVALTAAYIDTLAAAVKRVPAAIDVVPVGYSIVTKPYRSLGATGVGGTTVKLYTPVGTTKDKQGNITRVALKDITGDTIAAGTPVLMLATSTDTVARVNFHADYSATVAAPATVNGLHGVLVGDSVSPLSLSDASPVTAAGTIDAIGLYRMANESGYLVLSEIEGEAQGDTTLTVASILKITREPDALGRVRATDVNAGATVVFYNASNAGTNPQTYLAVDTKTNAFAYSKTLTEAAVWTLEAATPKTVDGQERFFYYLRNNATGRYITSPRKGSTSTADRNLGGNVSAIDTAHALRIDVANYGDFRNVGYGLINGLDNLGVDLLVDRDQMMTTVDNQGHFVAVAHNNDIGNYNSQWGWYMWRVQEGHADLQPLLNALADADSTLSAVGLVGGLADSAEANALRNTVAGVDSDALAQLSTVQRVALLATLNAQTAAAQAHKLLQVQDGAVYFIEGSNGAHNPEFFGAQVYVTSLAGGQPLRWRANNKAAGNYAPQTRDNARFMFRFKKNEAGLWTIQNVATGRYLTLSSQQARGAAKYTMSATATGFNVVTIPDGTIGLSDPTNTANAFHGDVNGNIVGWAHNGNADGTQWAGSNCSFRLRPVKEDHLLDTIAAGYSVVTLPYTLQGAPWSQETTVKAYRVVGYEAQGRNMTGIKLKALAEDEPIAAGTPFVLHVEGDTTAYIELPVNMNSLNLTLQADTANGLVGVLRAPATLQAADTLATLDAQGTVQPVSEQTVVALHKGYLVSNLIAQTAEEPDAVLAIAETGKLVGIEQVKPAATADTVNVYTIDGLLLRRHVPAATATQGLAKGLYIVGKKKVLVK